jgi:hypothetical protein
MAPLTATSAATALSVCYVDDVAITRFPGVASTVSFHGDLVLVGKVTVALIPFLFGCDSHVHSSAQGTVLVFLLLSPVAVAVAILCMRLALLLLGVVGKNR